MKLQIVDCELYLDTDTKTMVIALQPRTLAQGSLVETMRLL